MDIVCPYVFGRLCYDTGMPVSKRRYPIEHWSHSSLVAYLRNPLAWYKRYVEKVYDAPRSPSAVVGSAGHKALERFYAGMPKDLAIAEGLAYLRGIDNAQIDLGKAASRRARRVRRALMEREYLQAIGFYLAKPPRHRVLGVEVSAVAKVEGLALPVKAISDLVVASRVEPGAVDIVDHKFVAAFSASRAEKPLFLLQAVFNYYTVRALYGRPVRRFIVYECKKTKNVDGRAQLRRYALDYRACGEAFALFHRLLADATRELARNRLYLPNPSDLFEGEHSVDLYRLGLVGGEE